MSVASSSFVHALHADQAASDRADKMRLYGWLIGRWEMDSVIDADDGTKQSGPRGEIHFGWVLEGRAIQDVWILPGVFYGTTLRVYDPGLDAWHILWSDPLRQVYTRQIGRARSQTGFIRLAADQESRNRASPTSGDDIVQEGKADDGTPMRWSFTEITPDSFHWLGERSPNGGKTWKMQIEFFARRAKS